MSLRDPRKRINWIPSPQVLWLGGSYVVPKGIILYINTKHRARACPEMTRLCPAVRTPASHQPRAFLPTNSSSKERSGRWQALSLEQCVHGEARWVTWCHSCLEKEKIRSETWKTQSEKDWWQVIYVLA